MILERIPFEIIALIYFFMGPYTQSQFGKTCKILHDTLKISDEFFDNSGVLKVWHTHQIWNKEEDESLLKMELAHLLFDQPGVKLYARFLMHGVQPEFDPYADFHVPFLMRLKYFTESRPVLEMTNIDPEVLALLVSMYPKEMLTDKWYGKESSDFADQCDELLLRTYCLKKRAKCLLKVVYTAHPISLQNMMVSCQLSGMQDYFGTGLICALLKRSRMDRTWHYEYLEDISAFLTSPKAMLLLFKVTDDESMSISLEFLEKSLKLGVPVPEIQRCLHHYSVAFGDQMSETTKQILLHLGAGDEAFVMDCMCEFAQGAKRFTWTDDDNINSSFLGYSDAFRTRMQELHDEAPKDIFLKISSYFQ